MEVGGWHSQKKNVFERAKVEPTRANVRYLVFGKTNLKLFSHKFTSLILEAGGGGKGGRYRI